MLLDHKIMQSSGIARPILHFLEAALCLLRTSFVSATVRPCSPSCKYILSTIYYSFISYAVLNFAFVAELPSNTDRSNEWVLSVILTALDYIHLFARGDLTQLLYNTLLQER